MNLRVLARGNILVLDTVFAQATGARRYVGRSAVAAWKEEELPEGEPRHTAHNAFLAPGEKPVPHVAYPKNSQPVEAPCDRYYMRALQAAELWPADKPTADCVGVAFDPSFGGEYPSTVKAPVKGSKAGE